VGLNLSARDVLRSRAAVRLPRAKQSTVGVEDVNGFGLAGSLSFFCVNMYSLSATTLIWLKAKDKGSSIQLVVKKIWNMEDRCHRLWQSAGIIQGFGDKTAITREA
jgi:hypothetical protein